MASEPENVLVRAHREHSCGTFGGHSTMLIKGDSDWTVAPNSDILTRDEMREILLHELRACSGPLHQGLRRALDRIFSEPCATCGDKRTIGPTYDQGTTSPRRPCPDCGEEGKGDDDV